MKITKNSKDSNWGIHGAYALENNDVDYLVGRLMTLIDAAGLEGNQSKSIKDLVKQEVYQVCTGEKYIEGKIICLAKDVLWEIRDENMQRAGSVSKEDRRKGLHPAWIKGEYELTFTSEE